VQLRVEPAERYVAGCWGVVQTEQPALCISVTPPRSARFWEWIESSRRNCAGLMRRSRGCKIVRGWNGRESGVRGRSQDPARRPRPQSPSLRCPSSHGDRVECPSAMKSDFKAWDAPSLQCKRQQPSNPSKPSVQPANPAQTRKLPQSECHQPFAAGQSVRARGKHGSSDHENQPLKPSRRPEPRPPRLPRQRKHQSQNHYHNCRRKVTLLARGSDKSCDRFTIASETPPRLWNSHADKPERSHQTELYQQRLQSQWDSQPASTKALRLTNNFSPDYHCEHKRTRAASMALVQQGSPRLGAQAW
jgi:hypothetical protein